MPSEATFSRAFDEFAASDLASRVHEGMIEKTHKSRLIGHISRDATAIPAREARVRTSAPATPPKRQRGRPKKSLGPRVPPPERRIVRQTRMTLAEMLADLPTTSGVGDNDVRRWCQG